MDEIREDIKDLKAEVKIISTTLLRNTVSLELHERRTTLAETRMDRYEAQSKWVIGLISSGVFTIIVKLFLS